MNNYLDIRGVSHRRIPFQVIRKAEKIIKRIEDGEHWAALGGKQMWDRTTISVPVGRKWRLVGKRTGNGVQFTELMSHEHYNNRK